MIKLSGKPTLTRESIMYTLRFNSETSKVSKAFYDLLLLKGNDRLYLVQDNNWENDFDGAILDYMVKMGLPTSLNNIRDISCVVYLNSLLITLLATVDDIKVVYSLDLKDYYDKLED